MAVNYANFAQTVDPMRIAQQGVDLGNIMLQADANKLKMEEYQSAKASREAFNADVAALGTNPSPQQYFALMQKHPTMAEALKTNYDILNTNAQQSRLSEATNVYAALNAGQNDMAIQMLESRQEAAMNSGNQQEADSAKALASLIRANPDSAKITSGLFLSSALGPEKFAETWEKINKSRIDTELSVPQLNKAKADARAAATAAKFSELKPVIDAATAGLDISFMVDNPNLKRMNVELATKTKQIQNLENQNKLKEAEKLRLEVAELRFKQDKDAQDLLSQTRNQLGTASNSVNTVRSLIDLGKTDVGFGRTVIDAATGSLEGITPAFGSSQPVADFIAGLETVKSQLFLDGVEAMKGLGALTGPEGDRIIAAAGSLERTQSAAKMQSNLDVIFSGLERAEATLKEKYGSYETAVEAYNESRATNAQASGTDLRAQADAILRGE